MKDDLVEEIREKLVIKRENNKKRMLTFIILVIHIEFMCCLFILL
jgi:hypothetical protein